MRAREDVGGEARRGRRSGEAWTRVGGAVGGGWRQPELERRGDREWRWCRSTEHGGSAAGRAAAASSGVTPVGSLRRALAILWWIERMEREAGGRWGGRG